MSPARAKIRDFVRYALGGDKNLIALAAGAAALLALYAANHSGSVFLNAFEIFGIAVAFGVFTSHLIYKLKKTADFNRILLETIPFAIDIVDNEGNILFLNKRMQEKFGKAARGKKCWELYKDNKRQCVECPLKKSVSKGVTADIEVSGAFGGRTFRVVHTGMVFEGKKAIMEIFRDITEQKSVEIVLEDARVYAENIVDTIREPLVVLSSDLKVVSANWFFYYTFRFLKEDTENRPFFEIYDHYWDIPALRECLAKVVGQNAAFHDFEIDHIFSAAGSRTMLFSARRIYHMGHDKPRILLAIKDITDQKRAEEAMRVSEKKYRYLFDNASDAIITIDLEDKIVSWNRSAERIFGWKQEEVVGKKFETLTVPKGLEKERKNFLSDVFSGKSVSGIETIRLKKDGAKIYASISAFPIINEKKEIIGLSGIIRDVTKEKEIDRAKTEFVSVASHQLRTPLANMGLALEMLLDGIAGEISAEQKKYLRGIHLDIRGMAELVDALLNVSRIELRTLVIDPEPANLGEITENILKEFEPQIKKKDLSVKTNISDNLPVINIDRNLMKIILQNLFSNAVKYTPAGGTVTGEIKKEKNNAIIKVADTGCGIPEDQQKKIFSKLFRARNAIDLRSEGVGLGLYIAKSMVDRFGGKIWFESKENKGTTFYVSVPLKGMKKQREG